MQFHEKNFFFDLFDLTSFFASPFLNFLSRCAIHTNADKANVEGGGHGGEGNLSGGPIEPAVDTPPIVVVP